MNLAENRLRWSHIHGRRQSEVMGCLRESGFDTGWRAGAGRGGNPLRGGSREPALAGSARDGPGQGCDRAQKEGLGRDPGGGHDDD